MAGRRPRDLDYLVEAKCIAMKINASDVPVKAYWFFTPYTLPDKTLLNFLRSDKHEIGLHIIKDPQKELAELQRVTGKIIQHYTIHGTNTTIAQLIWGRKLGQKQATIPNDFPLKSFHSEPTHSLDRACFSADCDTAYEEAVMRVSGGFVLAMHPEWWIKSNEKDRGPYDVVLHRLLGGHILQHVMSHS